MPSEQRPLPEWAWVHAELRRPGVTLALLWQAYHLSQPQGFQYSWFCEHYTLKNTPNMLKHERRVLKRANSLE